MIEELVLSFKAMGTDVQVVACTPKLRKSEALQALNRVKAHFTETERTISRFQPISELSMLNASAGRAFRASRTLFAVVQASLEAARATHGLFDPTILDCLVAAGYDCDFELVRRRANRRSTLEAARSFGWEDVRLVERRREITLPVGCGLDLGGIGKGWTVDRARRYLKSFPGYAVDAGGDMVVGGRRADGSLWRIGVSDPFDQERDIVHLEVGEGAVCTSSVVRRSWPVDGGRLHHLIDPRTGRPSSSGVAAATVVAGSAARAEAVTKAAIVLGPEAGMQFMAEQNDADGLLVLSNRRLMVSPSMPVLQHAA